jgi:hypothetical protein
VTKKKRRYTAVQELSVTRTPTVSGAEGGEHHISDYNDTGHTRNGIIGDLKKRTIHRRAGTVGDRISYSQRCHVAVSITLVTIKFLSNDPHKDGIVGD